MCIDALVVYLHTDIVLASLVHHRSSAAEAARVHGSVLVHATSNPETRPSSLTLLTMHCQST
jgi:hypothetical protein